MAIITVNLVPDLGKTRASSNNSYGATHNCYYFSNRAQQLITAAMLNTLGIPKGAFIRKIGYYIYTIGGSTYIKNFRIQAAHTTLTALTTTWVSTGFQYIYGTAGAGIDVLQSSLTINAYNSFETSSKFVWNGTNNIIIDLSRTDTAYTTKAGNWGIATAPGYGNILHTTRDVVSTHPLTSAGTRNANMVDLYMEWEYVEPINMFLGISL